MSKSTKETIAPAALSNQPPSPAADKPCEPATWSEPPAPPTPAPKPGKAVFDPDCLLEKQPCPACAGKCKIKDPAWAKWRRDLALWVQATQERLEENKKRMLLKQPPLLDPPLPGKPPVPTTQEEVDCTVCDGLGQRLSPLGQRLVEILERRFQVKKPGAAAPFMPVTGA